MLNLMDSVQRQRLLSLGVGMRESSNEKIPRVKAGERMLGVLTRWTTTDVPRERTRIKVGERG